MVCQLADFDNTLDTHMNKLHPLVGAMLCAMALGAQGADSYDVLPDGIQQLRSTASASIETIDHPAPLLNYRDYRGQYLVNAHVSDQLYIGAAALDPNSLENSAASTSDMGFGWMHDSVSSAASSKPPPGSVATHSPVSVKGYADQAFSDLLTIDSTGLTGRDGLAHAKVQVFSNLAHTLGAPNIGSAAREGADGSTNLWINRFDWKQFDTESEANIWGRGGTSNVLTYKSDNFSTTYAAFGPHSNQPLSSYDGAPVAGWVTLNITIPFTFGTTFGIEAFGGADSIVGLGVPILSPNDPLYAFLRQGQSSTTFDMRWGGIDSVELDSSTAPNAPSVRSRAPLSVLNPAINFTVVSGSGVDYSHAIEAVPEPQTWALFLTGVVCLGVMRRRLKIHGLVSAVTCSLAFRWRGPCGSGIDQRRLHGLLRGSVNLLAVAFKACSAASATFDLHPPPRRFQTMRSPTHKVSGWATSA